VAALLALAGAAETARADIGFPAAAAACRALAPGQKLMALRQRTRNGTWVYEGDLANVPPTDFTTATIDRDTGALLDLATAPMPPDERAATQQAIQRLNYATADFAQAQAAANLAAGRADTERIELLYEGGILAFRVSYFDAPVLIEIDSITGAPIPPVVPGLGIEPTVSVAEMAGAIAHAQWVTGGGWTVIEATALQRFDGITVRVLLVNRVSGNMTRHEVVQGFLIPGAVFAPLGGQISRAAMVAPGSPVSCPPIAALAAVQSASAGLGVNGISLEQGGTPGAPSYAWVVRLVDAEGVERDAHVDATLPAQGKSAEFTAPVDLAPGDFTRDGTVDARDLAELLAYWGAFNPILDVNNTGVVDAGDLAVALGDWAL
jgi:hypothetical protein